MASVEKNSLPGYAPVFNCVRSFEAVPETYTNVLFKKPPLEDGFFVTDGPSAVYNAFRVLLGSQKGVDIILNQRNLLEILAAIVGNKASDILSRFYDAANLKEGRVIGTLEPYYFAPNHYLLLIKRDKLPSEWLEGVSKIVQKAFKNIESQRFWDITVGCLSCSCNRCVHVVAFLVRLEASALSELFKTSQKRLKAGPGAG